MWNYSNVRKVHMELSNYCNAACPCCTRNIKGGDTRGDLVLSQISIEQFKSWVPEEFIRHIEQWTFCGGQGDPGMCKDLVEILDYITRINPTTRLYVNTNGGMRDTKFWSSVAQYFNRSDTIVVWSIDGLADTNHIYRRGVKFDKVIENAKAFINAGGTAYWEYLIFGHNEHQIPEAERLAAELGFAQFTPKKALGFEGSGVIEVFDTQGQLEYKIYPPSDEARNADDSGCRFDPTPVKINISDIKNWQRQVKEESIDIVEVKKGLEKLPNFSQLDSNYVSCRSLIERPLNKPMQEIFVTADGTVYPCCFIGTRVPAVSQDPIVTQVQYFVNDAGPGAFNLNRTTLESAISKLTSVYSTKWGGSIIGDNKLAFCADICKADSKIDRIWQYKK